MKFGKRLQYECVVEWEEKYLNYHELKLLITAIITHMKKTTSKHGSRKMHKVHKENPRNSPFLGRKSEESPLIAESLGSDMGDFSDSQSVRAENMVFFKKIGEEMTKVDAFFLHKEAELQTYYTKLIEAVDAVTADGEPPALKLRQLRTAFTEFYRGLCMLENYVELNCEGFRKIFKKHEKLTGLSHKDQGLATLHTMHFYKSTIWKEMMISTESLYAKVYKLPKSEHAKQQLVPTRLIDSSNSNMFKLGIAIGMCIALLMCIFFLFSHGQVDPHAKWNRFIAVIPVYRAVLIPLIALWLWGCNVYIWTKKRVNYNFIFALDPRSSLDYNRIFKTASTLSAVWLTSFFLFVATVMGNLSFFGLRAEVYPLILIIFNLILVLFPFRALHRRSRWMLFTTLYNIVISPFGDIHFMCLYVGDVLTSMVKTLFDIEYTICYYTTGDWLVDDGAKCDEVNRVALPVLSALPYFWRLIQCLKRYRVTGNKINLGNAGKYGVACTVIIFGGINGYQSYPMAWTPLRIIWLISFIFATLYNYLWDVFMDWGLGRKEYKGLRKQLLYRPRIWVYYYVIISNFIFRFAWTGYITPTGIYIGINPEFFATILSVVEIFRRFTWSVFRVEYEQVINMGENRAVTFADLPVRESKVAPPVASINGEWTGRGPFDVIVEFLQRRTPPPELTEKDDPSV